MTRPAETHQLIIRFNDKENTLFTTLKTNPPLTRDQIKAIATELNASFAMHRINLYAYIDRNEDTA